MGKRRNRHAAGTASRQATRLLDSQAVERADSALVKPATVKPAPGVDWDYVRTLRKLYPPPYDPTPLSADWNCPA